MSDKYTTENVKLYTKEDSLVTKFLDIFQEDRPTLDAAVGSMNNMLLAVANGNEPAIPDNHHDEVAALVEEIKADLPNRIEGETEEEETGEEETNA